jgi:hypothetical protein
VNIEDPPALGDSFKPAEALPLLRPTSRVLRITLTDGGSGYTASPQVTILSLYSSRPCQAIAVLDRKGRVESVLVLDPGYGYGGPNAAPPQIVIEPPKGKNSTVGRQATAVAEMEYEVYGVKILKGGNGYVSTEPPSVMLSPPMDDPDWYLDVQEQPQMRIMTDRKREWMKMVVTEMVYADGNVAYSAKGKARAVIGINDAILNRLERDPLELLPSAMRPEKKVTSDTQRPFYIIPSVAAIPQFVAVLSPRYRATDPVFGSVGRVPVTKGAVALTASEYGRLAISGAVCTVLVRTALNPLELVKTKLQLQNDAELLNFARSRVQPPPTPPSPFKSPSLALSQSAVQMDANGVHTESLPRVQMSSSAAPTILPRSDGVAVLEMTEVLPAGGEVKGGEVNATTAANTVEEPKVNVGTLDILRSMVALRGPMSLFQSADITFLASLVFGSFGFGATELFRRSFALHFLGVEGAAEQGSEIVLLLAAAVATVVTAAAASPFEVLRVRSMGQVESKSWTQVLQEYIVSIS